MTSTNNGVVIDESAKQYRNAKGQIPESRAKGSKVTTEGRQRRKTADRAQLPGKIRDETFRHALKLRRDRRALRSIASKKSPGICDQTPPRPEEYKLTEATSTPKRHLLRCMRAWNWIRRLGLKACDIHKNSIGQ
jgi:hypothetical protein